MEAVAEHPVVPEPGVILIEEGGDPAQLQLQAAADVAGDDAGAADVITKGGVEAGGFVAAVTHKRNQLKGLELLPPRGDHHFCGAQPAVITADHRAREAPQAGVAAQGEAHAAGQGIEGQLTAGAQVEADVGSDRPGEIQQAADGPGPPRFDAVEVVVVQVLVVGDPGDALHGVEVGAPETAVAEHTAEVAAEFQVATA